MDAAEFKAARLAADISQGALAKRLGVARATVNRYETGASAIPDEVAATVLAADLSHSEPATVVALPLPTKRAVFDPVAAGLKPWGDPPPGLVERDLAKNPLGPGWQRCAWRVVHASIPSPIPFHAPPWAGTRGIMGGDGRVYDYATGQRMRDYQGGAPSPKPPPGSMAKRRAA